MIASPINDGSCGSSGYNLEMISDAIIATKTMKPPRLSRDIPNHLLEELRIMKATEFLSSFLNKASVKLNSWLNDLIVTTPLMVSAKCDMIGEAEIFSSRCSSRDEFL